MNRILSTAFAAVLAAGLAAGIAGFPAPARAELSAEEKAEVARIEAYVNQITTLRATLLALDSEATQAIGRLWVQRPDKVRIDFGPPRGLLAVANDGDLDYFDPSVKRSSSIPISVTPLEPLFEEEIKLSGEITITKVRRKGNLLHVTAVATDDPDGPYVVLTFTYDPLEIRQWTLVDEDGGWIRFVLLDAVWGEPLEKKLFWWVDPN